MRNITKIVIHHAAVAQPDAEILLKSINRTHKQRLHPNPNGYGNHAAYHFIIGGDGTVLKTRPFSEPGYHASNWDVNQESIGICLAGDFDSYEPSDEQYLKLSEIIAELQTKFNLTIHLHNEFANKTCPGNKFDINRIIPKIKLSKNQKRILKFGEKVISFLWNKIPHAILRSNLNKTNIVIRFITGTQPKS